jgi:hypothetical protein
MVCIALATFGGGKFDQIHVKLPVESDEGRTLKNLHLMTVIAMTAVTVPVAADADAWNDYLHFSKNYYSFNLNSFKSITCHIDEPLIAQRLNQYFAEQLHIKAAAALTAYIVTIANTGDITFTDPVMRVLSADPKRPVGPGYDSLAQTYFKALMPFPDHQFKGAIGEYLPPDKTKMTIDAISTKGDKTQISGHTSDGAVWHGVFSGAEAEGTDIEDVKLGDQVMHVTGTMKNHYQLVDGKYLLRSKEEDSVANGVKGNVDISITYQVVAGITLPKTFIAQSRGESGVESTDTIELEDCIVRK